MKKIFIFSFLVMFLMTAFSVDVDAQYRRKKKKKKKKKPTTERSSEYFDESGGDILTKLWFGADVNFNFGAFNGGSQFTYGLSPMTGYKITDDFSAGPKISFLNTIQKFSSSGSQEATLNAINLGGGIFARHKILTNYFVHAEYEVISEERPITDGVFVTLDPENKIITERNVASHYYLGVGYGGNSGSGLGFTSYALWDFSQEFSSTNIPLVVRFGITYKF